MDIETLDFMHAKSAVDYMKQVFQIELDDEIYAFHIYNVAFQLSLSSGMSEALREHMANKDDFLENIKAFSDRYWEMINETSE